MPSGDTRKDFLVATTGNYFGIQSSDSVLDDVRSSKELNIFLDDGNSPVLAAKYDTHQGHKSIKLSNNVEPSDTAEKVLVFFKLQPKAITPDNIHQNVFVSSMLSSPVNTLYHSVQKVFAPLLLKDEKWSRNIEFVGSGLGRRQTPSFLDSKSPRRSSQSLSRAEMFFPDRSVDWTAFRTELKWALQAFANNFASFLEMNSVIVDS